MRTQGFCVSKLGIVCFFLDSFESLFDNFEMKLFALLVLQIALVFIVVITSANFSRAEDFAPYALSNSREGFSEADDQPSQPSIVAALISDLIFSRSYSSMLTLRFSCVVKNSIFSLVPRFKNVKWSFVDQSKVVKFQSGEVETDTKGFARITFSSPEPIVGRLVEVSLGHTRKQIRLGFGPYAIEVGEEGCLHAR